MTRILLLLMLIGLMININQCVAQTVCGTSSSTPPEWIFTQTKNTTRSSSNYMINIFIHVLRNSKGEGNNAAESTNRILENLNKYFQGAGIQFQSIGSENINDDNYYREVVVGEQTDALLCRNSHNNAIDIYILPAGNRFMQEKNGTILLSGLSDGIPGHAIIVGHLEQATTTIAHEMGHCLGLYHTHHGTVKESTNDAYQCAELVDGSNRYSCGDYIADTPADPNKWGESCSYTKKDRDANGKLYCPDPTNIMSYAKAYCRSNFTPLQIERMKEFIEKTPQLQAVISATFPSVSGFGDLSSNNVFTLENFPTGYTVKWEIDSPDMTIISQDNTSATVKAYKYDVAGTLKALIYKSGILQIEIPKNIFTPELQVRGNEFISGVKERYEINYTPSNAKVAWRCTNGLVIHESGDNYVIVSNESGTTVPWIEAIVTDKDGIQNIKRTDLKYKALESASFEMMERWYGKNAKGEGVWKYYYRVNYKPADIPLNQLTFSWRNTVRHYGPDFPNFQIIFGQATIKTDGELWGQAVVNPLPFDSLTWVVPKDSLFASTLSGFNPTKLADPVGPDAWQRRVDVNIAVVTMPTTGERGNYVEGDLICYVSDKSGNKCEAKAFLHEEVYVVYGSNSYNCFPNPAKDIITISRMDQEDRNKSGISPLSESIAKRVTVNLYDNMLLICTFTFDRIQEDADMNVADLPEGNYYLNILEEGRVVDSRVVLIQR